MKKIPTVVIVGRINVGKSSLFNRLTETQKALVSDIAGTTRDYNLGQVAWGKKTFQIIDTGGVNIDVLKNSIQSLLTDKKSTELKNIDDIEKEIIVQTKTALKKADLILMVTDAQTGLLPDDKELALVLKKLNIPVMLVCNKVDNIRLQHQTNEFYKLGLGQPINISSANGSGTGDLLDEITKKIKGPKGRPKKIEKQNTVKVAIIGKPNVGKSSLVNKILGENRVIVSPIPQTTREPQDTEINYLDQKIILIDTAGLRKQAKIKAGLEHLSTKRTLSMIKSADIILLVTEADKLLTAQDSHIAGLCQDAKAGIIILANKWDLITDKDEKIDTQVKKYYQSHFPYLDFAPLLFISAKTGRNVDKIMDLILAVAAERKKQIEEKELNKLLARIVKQQRPVQARGPRRPYLYGLTQTKNDPPLFTITVGKGESIHFSYLRFIENQLRAKYEFLGIPIKIIVKALKH
jgi:GTP-binding protein